MMRLGQEVNKTVFPLGRLRVRLDARKFEMALGSVEIVPL